MKRADFKEIFHPDRFPEPWTANVQPLCHNEPSENTNSNPTTAHRQARTRRPPTRDLGLRWQAQRDTAFAGRHHPIPACRTRQRHIAYNLPWSFPHSSLGPIRRIHIFPTN